MPQEFAESKNITGAKQLLSAIKKSPLSLEERQLLSIKLTSYIVDEARKHQRLLRKRGQIEIHKLLNNPSSKGLLISFIDECFRSSSSVRSIEQLGHLLYQYGIPTDLNFFKYIEFFLIKLLGPHFPSLFFPLIKKNFFKEIDSWLLPKNLQHLNKSILTKKQEGLNLNIANLSDTTHSNKEVENNIKHYINDLKNPNIDYISVKISSISPPLPSIIEEKYFENVANNLKQLFRLAMKNQVNTKGSLKPKFINLDMETYSYYMLTIDLFENVLNEPEFLSFFAGITLQAYLPNSFEVQKRLTAWAKNRIQNMGAPIKISIVKGAYLGNEQITASLKNWPQTPFLSKAETDSNFKRMLMYGLEEENINAVHIGVGTHNPFDVAFGLILQKERGIFSGVEFEMLEARTPHVREVIQKLITNSKIRIYCPKNTSNNIENVIQFFLRRFEESTGHENYLKYAYGLHIKSTTFQELASLFSQSLHEIRSLPSAPRQQQNRNNKCQEKNIYAPFENEPQTNFKIPPNKEWAQCIIQTWQDYQPAPIPLVIGGQEFHTKHLGYGCDPSKPKAELYQYSLAQEKDIDLALYTAKANEEKIKKISTQEKSLLLARTAKIIREKRSDFIGTLMLDTAKIISDADWEVSATIDVLKYLRERMDRMLSMKDITLSPKGPVLVLSTWRSALLISAAKIAGALLCGNPVIFKPSQEAAFAGWQLIQAFWEAGFSKEVLQYVNCTNEMTENKLLKGELLSSVVLTSNSQTAKKLIKLCPQLDFNAITGGRNTMIITSLADRDEAIKDLISSAFTHSGQFFSSTAIAILEKEVYLDQDFLYKLKNAAASLKVGSVWDLQTQLPPLIFQPDSLFEKPLYELENDESWLLIPKKSNENPHLCSPGIKYNVTQESKAFTNPLYGPILSLMGADNLKKAIKIANSTHYGQSAALHSLDKREHIIWHNRIQAGNCYINRNTIHPFIRREPFGGCKNSSFGNGYKFGGPNFLQTFLTFIQTSLPKEKKPVNEWVNSLTSFIEKIDLSAEQLGLWYASVANYAFWGRKVQQLKDITKIVGQDNLFGYVPRKNITLRLEKNTSIFDALRACAAALTCECSLEISWDGENSQEFNWLDLIPVFDVVMEDEKDFLHRIETGKIKRLRLISPASKKIKQAAVISPCYVIDSAVLANGRYELLHYLREVTISYNYHRFGNLGIREGELRKPLY